MDVRRRILIASVSAVAIAGAAAPALAADAAAAADKNGDAVSEVVVTGFRESLERAIEIKRTTINQVDAISSTDIGKLPDKNVADALQRIPGVNTSSSAGGEGGFDENDRVSIRGTSPSLTNVTIDGHAVATGDWFILDQYATVGRSVSFNLLPSEIVSSTLVYKTQSADLSEGGVAGVVDVITHKPLDFTKALTFQGQAEAAYNSISGETKPQVNGFINWKNADSTFGVSLAGFYEERSVERFGQETLGYTAISASNPIGAAHPDTIGVLAPTLIGSSLFKQDKKREGGSFAVEYKPNENVDLSLTGFYSKLDASNVNDNYMYWGANELKANSPTSYQVKDNTLVNVVWPAGAQGLVVDAITRPNEGSYTSYINFDGKFRVSDHITLKTQIGYTQGAGNTPQQPSFEVVGGDQGISVTRAGNGWTISPVGVNTQSSAGLASGWAWNAIFHSADKEIYGKVDGDWELNDGVFKDALFGVRINKHTRQVDGWDRGCTLGANNACWDSPTMPYSAVHPTPYPSNYTSGALGVPGLLIPIAGNPTDIANIINAIPGGVRGSAAVTHTPQNYYWTNSFKVQETDYAGYLMAKVGGDGWRGNFGVRLVGTNENAFVNVPSYAGAPGVITTSAFGDYLVDNVKHSYLDILPSVNFTFDLRPNLFLRLSAAETMARPDYSAWGGPVSLTDLTNTGSQGNPDLKPIKSAVYDAALEWYYRPGAIAAVSVFYDDLSSYVAYTTKVASYVDQQVSGQGAPVYEPYTISYPINRTGELKGIEVQVQQPIGMGFGFQANGTYIESHDDTGAPLVGTSKFTGNLVGYYENKWLSARLAYTYRSHYFLGLDHASPESEAGNGQLDMSVNVTVTPNVALSVDALNLTDSKLIYYAANRTQVRAVYENGTQLFAGVHVKF